MKTRTEMAVHLRTLIEEMIDSFNSREQVYRIAINGLDLKGVPDPDGLADSLTHSVSCFMSFWLGTTREREYYVNGKVLKLLDEMGYDDED